MRTTGLQVSGYAFLLRRTELALVIGDPRMAQDPLRTQRRAIGVGLLLSLLVAGGMLLVAMLRPQPSIDGAGLVADESGALHVRIDDVFHPVTNVASARLLLGSTEEVTRSTSAQLSQLPSGPPVGISDAPGVVAAASSQWVLCRDGVVAATGGSVQDAGPVVVDAPNGLWLVVDDTRMLLGPSDGIGGQLARAVGAAPVPVTEGMLQVLRRGPDVSLGALDGLVTSGDRVFLAGPTRVAEMTGTRRAVAEVLVPTPAEQLPLAEILSRPEMTGTAALSHVPAAMSFDTVEEVCVGDGVVHAPDPGAGPAVGPGSHFAGPRGTSAVLTERGFVLVSEAGVRYSVTSVEELEAMGDWGGEGGVAALPEVSFRVLEPLPDGGVLSQDRARETLTSAAA